ncbi:hypothetical protein PENSTE_c009G09684 [Penicillium steckii]|uniref:Uncharacterized protein n=1 Tax=Penicillium steckii TaxID=303698 RepID=A0A1V6TBG8_9EURO|nr:hypothetical protein PENSTE_c009G09684 [Penicillium steckii]
MDFDSLALVPKNNNHHTGNLTETVHTTRDSEGDKAPAHFKDIALDPLGLEL